VGQYVVFQDNFPLQSNVRKNSRIQEAGKVDGWCILPIRFWTFSVGYEWELWPLDWKQRWDHASLCMEWRASLPVQASRHCSSSPSSFSLLEVLSRLSCYCWPCISSFLTAITVFPSPRFNKSVYFSRFLHLIKTSSSCFSFSSSYILSPFFTFRMTFFYHFGSNNSHNWTTFNETCQLVLIQWCGVFLDKLTVPQLTKKLSAFYESRVLITAFTKTYYLSLS